MKWIDQKDLLFKFVVTDKLSYEEIGRKYNCSGTYIKKICRKLGIPLKQRRKINPSETFNKIINNKKICKCCGEEFISLPHEKAMYCSKECSNKYRMKLHYKNYLENQNAYYGPRNMRWIKNIILEEQQCRCSICGNKNIWENKPLIFILDHIDGHAYNNSRDNLRLICPNCDSQLDTYKRKNKNSDREYYRFNRR